MLRNSVFACSYLRLYSFTCVLSSRITTWSCSFMLISSSFRADKSDSSMSKPSISAWICSTTSRFAFLHLISTIVNS